MGLFSSKKQTIVGTTVSRVIDDDTLPDAVRTGVIKALFQNGDISAYMMEELVGGVAFKAERMYEYAAKHYAYGLPSGSVYSSTQGSEEVEALISSLEGGPITLEYSRFGPANYFHAIWYLMVRDHGYNPDTNEFPGVSAQKGFPVYLDKFELVIPASTYEDLESSAFEHWGPPSTVGYTPQRAAQTGGLSSLRIPPSVVVDDSATGEYVRATLTWQEGFEYRDELYQPVYKTEVFEVPLPEYPDEVDFFQAKYTYNGVTKYEIYEAGTGLYPTLDAVFDTAPDLSGTYFPFLYFRFNKTSMAELEGTPEYVTSKRMAKYLGVGYADMIEAIHENPDVDDVEQAMMTLAVPAQSENQTELRYLYDYFHQQAGLQNAGYTTPIGTQLGALMGRVESPTRNTSIIQDKRFKMSFGNNGIYKHLIPGNIGEVGTYAGGYRTTREIVKYIEESTGEEASHTLIVPWHYYRKQVTETLFEEIEVREMRMTYHIYGKYNAVGEGKDPILLVPLDHSITENYSMPVREELYSRSLHFVFNSRIVTKVKWYQQAWFQFVMIVVAVIIAIVSYGAAIEGLTAALAAGTISVGALINMLAMGLLKYLAVQEGIKLFVEAVGLEAAFFIAVLAAAYGMYSSFNTSGVVGAPWADTLLKVANTLASSIDSIMSAGTTALQEDYKDFAELAEEQSKSLLAAQDLLEGNNLLSPFILFGESPGDFYARTVHSGNIGAVAISAVSNYVDVALRLPEVSDTLVLQQ